MDTHFGIPMAKELAKAQKNNAADSEEEAEKPKSDKKNNSKTVPYQLKSGPKYTVFFMNNKERYLEKLIAEDHSESLNSAGVCIIGQGEIFLYRQSSLERTRKTLIHEAVHAYHDNTFPGEFHGYPQWFQEALAKGFGDHSWDGENLRIGIYPPFVRDNYVKHAMPTLLDFRDWINKKNGTTAVSLDQPKKSSKATKLKETIIESDMIDDFVRERVNYQRGDAEPEDDEAIHKAYTLYWVLGKYLFLERRDALNTILREMCTDLELEADPTRKQTTASFLRAYQKAFEKKPLTIEKIQQWLYKNPMTWEWVFNEWQFTGNSFNARADGAALLVFWKDGIIPPFVARPETEGCTIGIAVNYFDRKNYSTIRVHESGNVSFCVLTNGKWSNAVNIGTFRQRNSDMPLPREYRFEVRRNYQMIGIFINGQLFYEIESPPTLRMGMLLEGNGCEANFFLP